MKVSPPLERALRNNQRLKKLPLMLEFLAEQLQVSPNLLKIPSLLQSDEILDKYRRKPNASIKTKIQFKEQDTLIVYLQSLKSRFQDDPAFLYLQPFSQCCGAVEITFHSFLNHAVDLVTQNKYHVSVITLSSLDRFNLDLWTERSADDAPSAYELEIETDRSASTPTGLVAETDNPG